MSTPQDKSLEHKLFMMVSGISVFVSFVILIIDTFISQAFISSLVGLVALTTFASFYFLGKSQERFKVLVTPYIIVNIILINVAWFTGGGLNITNAFLFFLVMVLLVILAAGNTRSFFLVVLFTNLVIVLALEFLHPAYSQPEIKTNNLLVTNTVVIFLTFSIGAYMLIFFKNNYSLENARVKRQMIELDEKNAEIVSQNEELIQYQEETMAQRDFIEEKNTMLQEQALELEIANNEIQRINSSLERKIDERTRELKALNDDLDMLLYRSSHDFRRPITTLMGLCEVARLTVKDEVSRDLFSKTYATALMMDKMLLKFFMLYNINHFRNIYEGVSLTDIVSRIEKNLIARKKNIRFTSNIDITRYNPKDERNSLIEIILENLVENSLIYNAKDNKELALTIHENNGSLHIATRDNGNGIPEAYLDKIFDIYFRGSTLSLGNGLGLYVVKRAADALMAKIHVKSQLNEFSSFEVVFTV